MVGQVREAVEADFEAIWPIFREIVSAGETYPYPQEMKRDQAFHVWMELPRLTHVYEDSGQILGTYYIKSNQLGLGGHVCNCGYMVASAARGMGVASSMCEHSQEIARKLGYKAMQYNLVVSTNTAGVNLWTKMGFETVGRLPKAFNHPVYGFVDALVMYKWLL